MSDTDAVKLDVYRTLVHEVGDDPTFVAEVVDDYLRSCRELLEGMRQAVAAHQAGELARLSHQLKSPSAWLGANRLAELCGEIEESARSGTLERVGERMHEVEQEAVRVARALRALAQSA